MAAVATLRAPTPANGTRQAAWRGLWPAVGDLIDRARTLDDLRSHRLHLLAAHRYRTTGRAVPRGLAADERAAALLTLVAPLLLQQVRNAYDGEVLVLKGPEVAALYPDPALRPFRDLDLLVSDAHEARRALLAAGFAEAGDPRRYVGIHHLRPLALPTLPLVVELHERPKWIEGLRPPATAELLAAGIRSRVGVDGVLALPPEHHALVLAAHSWAHEPLRRLLELVDVAVVAEHADPDATAALAREWRIERAWRTTLAGTDAVLGRRRRPMPLLVWARNVGRVRERTVLESHLEHWLAPFWALPPTAAARASLAALAADLRPARGESWTAKLARSGQAFRNAFSPRSEHEGALVDREARLRAEGGDGR